MLGTVKGGLLVLLDFHELEHGKALMTTRFEQLERRRKALGQKAAGKYENCRDACYPFPNFM